VSCSFSFQIFPNSPRDGGGKIFLSGSDALVINHFYGHVCWSCSVTEHTDIKSRNKLNFCAGEISHFCFLALVFRRGRRCSSNRGWLNLLQPHESKYLIWSRATLSMKYDSRLAGAVQPSWLVSGNLLNLEDFITDARRANEGLRRGYCVKSNETPSHQSFPCEHLVNVYDFTANHNNLSCALAARHNCARLLVSDATLTFTGAYHVSSRWNSTEKPKRNLFPCQNFIVIH
jgi:hypothetical protein